MKYFCQSFIVRESPSPRTVRTRGPVAREINLFRVHGFQLIKWVFPLHGRRTRWQCKNTTARRMCTLYCRRRRCFSLFSPYRRTVFFFFFNTLLLLFYLSSLGIFVSLFFPPHNAKRFFLFPFNRSSGVVGSTFVVRAPRYFRKPERNALAQSARTRRRRTNNGTARILLYTFYYTILLYYILYI